MALVDQATRAATAVAETECKLLAINRAAFLQLVKTSPAFGAALLAGLAERAAGMAVRNK
jgi:CRP-like cAMP-binding protein